MNSYGFSGKLQLIQLIIQMAHQNHCHASCVNRMIILLTKCTKCQRSPAVTLHQITYGNIKKPLNASYCINRITTALLTDMATTTTISSTMICILAIYLHWDYSKITPCRFKSKTQPDYIHTFRSGPRISERDGNCVPNLWQPVTHRQN